MEVMVCSGCVDQVLCARVGHEQGGEGDICEQKTGIEVVQYYVVQLLAI